MQRSAVVRMQQRTVVYRTNRTTSGAASPVSPAPPAPPVAGDALRSTIDLSQGGLAAILRGGATGGMPTSGTASPDSVWRGDTAWRS